MKVSVIIPCYNEEEVLPLSHKRFSQVMESTAHDYELIFVNDGSKDHTEELLLGFANDDPHTKVISFSRIFYTISTWEPPLHKILVLSNMVTFHGNHSFSTKYKLKSFPFHWTHLFQLFCKLPAQIGSSCHKNHPFACKISFRHLFSRLSPSIQDRHHLALGSHLCCQSEFSVGTVTLVKSHSIFQSANFIISLACDQFF